MGAAPGVAIGHPIPCTEHGVLACRHVESGGGRATGLTDRVLWLTNRCPGWWRLLDSRGREREGGEAR